MPGIGSLELHDGNAFISHPDKKVMAPRAAIRLNANTAMPDALQEYISGMENIPIWAAQNQLTDFCRKLQELDANSEFALPDAGVFYKTSDGKLSFHSIALPDSFLPDVDANKVVHAGASHEILVGDTQTTTTQMAEYYSEETASSPKRWWIWPSLLGLLAVAGIVLYYTSHNGFSGSANQQPVEALKPVISYQTK